MDTLTHALSGALLARATVPRRTLSTFLPDPRTTHPPVWQRMLVGATAAAFPDADFVLNLVSPLTYLVNHRGETHSLLLLPFWALLVAWIAARVFRPAGGWRAFYGIVLMSIAAHILGDLITSFGTMVWSPFSDARVAWGTTFIIDLWFSGIIIAGLAASAIARRSRLPAVVGCLALVGYVGFQAYQKERATALGQEYAGAMRLKDASVSALPRAASPYHWSVVVSTRDQHHEAWVNVAPGAQPRAPGSGIGFIANIASHFQPEDSASWQVHTRFGNDAATEARAAEAWNRPEFAYYRWFAAYPALLGLESSEDGRRACVWFHDLRFANPGVDYEGFRHGMCRDGERWAPWALEGRRRVPLR